MQQSAQPSSVDVNDEEYVQTSSQEGNYVSEFVVTASGFTYNNHFRAPMIIRDLPRPTNPDNAGSGDYQVYFDETPDNLAEMRLAIHKVMWDVYQEFIGHPDQLNKLSALLYMKEDGTIAR